MENSYHKVESINAGLQLGNQLFFQKLISPLISNVKSQGVLLNETY